MEPIPPLKPITSKPEVHKKAWGQEVWIINDQVNNYCLKLLQFNKGANFSMHFHDIKVETWFVNKGELVLRWINTEDSTIKESLLCKGDTVHIQRLLPHQLFAIKDSEILEVSTFHRDSDSYRVLPGFSQLKNDKR